MKLGRSFLAGAMITLAASSAAHAGTKIMATAPANRTYPVTGNQQLNCSILNANTTAKTVTVDIMEYGGTVVDTTGPVSLGPLMGITVGDGIGYVAWCRFTVDGSTKKYRAAAYYTEAGVPTTAHVAK